MDSKQMKVSDFIGKRVLADKSSAKKPDATSKVGKIHAAVFHPTERRCVGFLVKRPDLALMFHRSDVFVAFNGFEKVDGHFVIKRDPSATDKGACKALGVNWDHCILWIGMPIVDKSGRSYGVVSDVTFEARTGNVISVKVSEGATANVILGVREIPASLIYGFKVGVGTELALNGETPADGHTVLGAILVSDEVANLSVEGGLAEKAGQATAVVTERAKEKVEELKPAVEEATHKASTAAKKATKATGKAVNQGAYATGRQLGRARGMFSAFKEEYDKARKDDE
jgi:sporulation protein YlmC with PRC-barrel domain